MRTKVTIQQWGVWVKWSNGIEQQVYVPDFWLADINGFLDMLEDDENELEED